MQRSLFSFLIIALLILVGSTRAQTGDTYEIDPGHTFVTFKVNRFTMVDVVSRFTDVAGTITFDEDDVMRTEAEVVIQTTSLESGLEQRDKAVKSEAFLDVANYQEITFQTQRVERRDGQFVAVGDLTIHGTTREVAFPFELRGPFDDPTGLTTIGLSGALTINRQDYGVAFDKRLPNGKPLIGNEVDIELNVLAVKSEE